MSRENDGLFYDDEVSAPDMNSSSGAGSDGFNSYIHQNFGTALRSPPVMDPFRRSFAVPVTSSPALDLPSFRTGQKHHSIPTTLSEYSSLLEYESPSSPESAVSPTIMSMPSTLYQLLQWSIYIFEVSSAR